MHFGFYKFYDNKDQEYRKWKHAVSVRLLHYCEVLHYLSEGKIQIVQLRGVEQPLNGD